MCHLLLQPPLLLLLVLAGVAQLVQRQLQVGQKWCQLQHCQHWHVHLVSGAL